MRPVTRRSYDEAIRTVRRHIESHLDEPLPLERLAGLACLSPFHFHRVFRGLVGETLAEHVRRLRLERAARRLSQPRPSVTEIALEAGYEATAPFSRAFHAAFGLSPTAYRRARLAGRTTVDAELRDGRPRPGGTKMEVRIETLEPLSVAFVRHVGSFDQVGDAWRRLLSWAGPRGLLGPKTRFLTAWLDDPEVTPAQRLRGDVCITLSRPIAAAGEVGVQELPGGEYAVATHRGSYDRLGEVYAYLCGDWAPRHGRELRDAPGFEIYLNNPQSTPAEQLLTDVYIPLAP